MLSHLKHLKLGYTPELSDKRVAESHSFRILKHGAVTFMSFYHLFKIDNLLDRLDEIRVNHRYLINLIHTHAVSQKLRRRINCIVSEIAYVCKHFLI